MIGVLRSGRLAGAVVSAGVLAVLLAWGPVPEAVAGGCGSRSGVSVKLSFGGGHGYRSYGHRYRHFGSRGCGVQTYTRYGRVSSCRPIYVPRHRRCYRSSRHIYSFTTPTYRRQAYVEVPRARYVEPDVIVLRSLDAWEDAVASSRRSSDTASGPGRPANDDPAVTFAHDADARPTGEVVRLVELAREREDGSAVFGQLPVKSAREAKPSAEAVNEAARVRVVRPDAEAERREALDRAWASFAGDELAAARAAFGQIAARHPRAVEPKLGYAAASWAVGDVRAASWAARRALALDPSAGASVAAAVPGDARAAVAELLRRADAGRVADARVLAAAFTPIAETDDTAGDTVLASAEGSEG